jgi:hypothetical protein
LVPILLVYLDLLLDKEPVTTAKLIGHGELIVITWVLSAGALGELIGSPAAHPVAKTILGGLALIVVIVATYYFGVVAEAQILAGSATSAGSEIARHVAEKAATIVDYSTWFFVLSLIPSVICVACT